MSTHQREPVLSPNALRTGKSAEQEAQADRVIARETKQRAAGTEPLLLDKPAAKADN